MKNLSQVTAVEEQQVRAHRQIKFVISKWQGRKFRLDVSPLLNPGRVVAQEFLHGRHTDAPQLFDRRNCFPDKLMLIATGLIDYLLIRVLDSRSNLGHTPAVNRIARDHSGTSPSRNRIETRRAIAATKDAAFEIYIAQCEHRSVLVERPSPWYDLLEAKHRFRSSGKKLHPIRIRAGPTNAVCIARLANHAP